jgi:hypothetical protein
VLIDQLELAKAQVEAYWSANWYDSLLGVVERAFTIPFHIAASVLVLRSSPASRYAGCGWRSAGTRLSAQARWQPSPYRPYLTEVLIGVFCMISLFIIFRLEQPEPIGPPEVDLTPLPPPLSAEALKPVEESDTTLEHSRYDTN